MSSGRYAPYVSEAMSRSQSPSQALARVNGSSSNSMIDSASTLSRQSAQVEYSLRTVSDPVDAEIDIVLVNGLIGDRTSTWMHDRVFWPGRYLSKDLGEARIFSFGLDPEQALRLKEDPSGSLVTPQEGDSLVRGLFNLRRSSHTAGRPIVFICHSLGGVVCEQAILLSAKSPNDRYRDIAKSTKGISFIGVPHFKDDMSLWELLATRVSNMLYDGNPALTRALIQSTEYAADVQMQFEELRRHYEDLHRPPLRLFCFYEEHEVTNIGKIVPRRSATIAHQPHCGIPADHVTMSQFTGVADSGYQTLIGVLDRWSIEVHSKGLSDRARAEYQGTAELERDVQMPRPRERTKPGSMNFSGTVHSSGGSVYQGTQMAGRDFHLGTADQPPYGGDD